MLSSFVTLSPLPPPSHPPMPKSFACFCFTFWSWLYVSLLRKNTCGRLASLTPCPSCVHIADEDRRSGCGGNIASRQGRPRNFAPALCLVDWSLKRKFPSPYWPLPLLLWEPSQPWPPLRLSFVAAGFRWDPDCVCVHHVLCSLAPTGLVEGWPGAERRHGGAVGVAGSVAWDSYTILLLRGYRRLLRGVLY
ncbi:unnamed protein product [Discosporangium mesarthrocarpum]